MARIRLTGCEVHLDQRRVVRPDGDVALGPVEAALLRVLAAHAGEDVPREVLLREVWGQDPASGTRAVDFAVRRLREKLGEPDPPRHLLTSHGVGYRLVTLERGEAPPIVAPARRRLRTAAGRIDLDERWVEVDGRRVDLTAAESALLERLAAAVGTPVPVDTLSRELWGRGQHQRSLTAMLGRLRRKIERDPREPAVLVTVRNVGVRLVAAHEPAAPSASTNLPADGGFVARAEVPVLRALAHERLVTLVGPAGIGKTRLARHVARVLLDEGRLNEVWFCDLAAVFDVDGVTRAVARTLGVRGEVSADAVAVALASRSAAGPVLLVLDNFEQVTVAALRVAAWLAAAPACRAWVTSRVATGLAGEAVLAVAPLDEEAAVALYEARSGGPSRRAEVRALVRRLDGLPLAIELAAARSAQLPPAALLARIEDRLELLVRAPDGLESHHSTLRGAIDWSWDLLGQGDRAALTAVSALLSPLDAPTAAALLGPDAARAVPSLVASSLLVPRPDGTWRMLEAIRAYASEKLHLSGRFAEVAERRADVVLAAAERAVASLDGPEGRAATQALAALHDDLVDLHRTADPDRGMRAAIALGRGAVRVGWTPEIVTALWVGIDRGPDRALAVDAWVLLAGACAETPDEDRAIDALDALVQTEAERVTVIRLRAVAACARREPGFLERMHEARAALLAIGEAKLAARLLGTIGWLTQAPLVQLQALLGQALAELDAVGDVAGRAVVRHHLAELAMHRGRFDEVDAHLRAGLDDAARTGAMVTELRLRHVAATLAAERGAVRRAEAELIRLEGDAVRAGFPGTFAVARRERAALAMTVERPALALELLAAHPAPTWSAATVNAAIAEMQLGRWASAAARLGAMQAHGGSGRMAWYARAFRTLALAGAGDLAGARALAEGLADARDPNLAGTERIAALAAGAVAVCEDPTRAATVRVLLTGGEWVVCDDGVRRELPSDVDLARVLLERILARV